MFPNDEVSVSKVSVLLPTELDLWQRSWISSNGTGFLPTERDSFQRNGIPSNGTGFLPTERDSFQRNGIPSNGTGFLPRERDSFQGNGIPSKGTGSLPTEICQDCNGSKFATNSAVSGCDRRLLMRSLGDYAASEERPGSAVCSSASLQVFGVLLYVEGGVDEQTLLLAAPLHAVPSRSRDFIRFRDSQRWRRSG